MARTLGTFSITREADGYVLHIEDEDGETTDYSATFEQLDLMQEAIEEQLELDDDDVMAADEDASDEDEAE